MAPDFAPPERSLHERIGLRPFNRDAGVVEFEFCLNDAAQAVLNPKGVNCLRSFPGRGLLVWGARTLSLDPLWRYVNVRRQCLAIIKQILVNLQWTVFEPNDASLWQKIVATLNSTGTPLDDRCLRAAALSGSSRPPCKMW